MKTYKKICPSCGNTILFSKYKVFWKSIKNNSTCRSCFYKSLIGKKLSDETKLKISNANKISLIGNIPSNKGKKTPLSVRKKLIKAHIGMKYGDDVKRKHRIQTLNRLKTLGISSSVDTGAPEFFKKLNEEGYNFKPKRFFEIGYDSDGYDEKKHIWCEFDTPYHRYPSQKNRDNIRQKNIITYFEKIGNPLNSFIRVSADKDGRVFEIKTIYKGVL